MLKRIGICPSCNHRIPVRVNGTFGKHKSMWGAVGSCPGTGTPCTKIVAEYNVYRPS